MSVQYWTPVCSLMHTLREALPWAYLASPVWVVLGRREMESQKSVSF